MHLLLRAIFLKMPNPETDTAHATRSTIVRRPTARFRRRLLLWRCDVPVVGWELPSLVGGDAVLPWIAPFRLLGKHAGRIRAFSGFLVRQDAIRPDNAHPN